MCVLVWYRTDFNAEKIQFPRGKYVVFRASITLKEFSLARIKDVPTLLQDIQ